MAALMPRATRSGRQPTASACDGEHGILSQLQAPAEASCWRPSIPLAGQVKQAQQGGAKNLSSPRWNGLGGSST